MQSQQEGETLLHGLQCPLFGPKEIQGIIQDDRSAVAIWRRYKYRDWGGNFKEAERKPQGRYLRNSPCREEKEYGDIKFDLAESSIQTR